MPFPSCLWKKMMSGAFLQIFFFLSHFIQVQERAHYVCVCVCVPKGTLNLFFRGAQTHLLTNWTLEESFASFRYLGYYLLQLIFHEDSLADVWPSHLRALGPHSLIGVAVTQKVLLHMINGSNTSQVNTGASLFSHFIAGITDIQGVLSLQKNPATHDPTTVRIQLFLTSSKLLCWEAFREEGSFLHIAVKWCILKGLAVLRAWG